MSYYDPFGRRYRPAQPQRRSPYQNGPGQSGAGAQPTLEDYHQLVETYKALLAQEDEVTKKLQATEEALRQQTKKAIELHEEVQTVRQEADQLRSALSHVATRNQQADGEWQERYLRLQAENENYRRRLEQRLAADADKQRNQILEDMLSLADHLEMALQHLERSVEADGMAASDPGTNVRQNLEATLSAFLETLRKHGVQPLDVLGQPFDPAHHEALGHVANPDVPEDHVAAVVRTGYTVDEQLLRPARVLVSNGAER